MATVTTLRAPNIAVLDQLKAINNTQELFEKYKPLAKTHTEGNEWNVAKLVGGFVLEALAIIAYKYAHKYSTVAATALGLAGVYTLYKSRVTAQIETPEYAAQKAAIKKEFDGVGPELRTSWEVASKLIAQAVQTSKAKTVEAANRVAGDTLTAYMDAANWWIATDPIKATDLTQQPWRETYKTLRPEVEKIARINPGDFADDKQFNPLIVEELGNLQTEAVRFLTGKAPSDGKHAYVENVVEGTAPDTRLVSRPWAV